MTQADMNTQAEMPLADLSFLADFDQNDELKAAVAAMAE